MQVAEFLEHHDKLFGGDPDEGDALTARSSRKGLSARDLKPGQLPRIPRAASASEGPQSWPYHVWQYHCIEACFGYGFVYVRVLRS